MNDNCPTNYKLIESEKKVSLIAIMKKFINSNIIINVMKDVQNKLIIIMNIPNVLILFLKDIIAMILFKEL
jgi:hypothetical protein